MLEVIVQFGCVTLVFESLLHFGDSENFQNSEQPKETIESRDSSKSQHFCIFGSFCIGADSFKNLERNRCENINGEPSFEIFSCDLSFVSNDFRDVTFLSCCEKGQTDINKEPEIYKTIKPELPVG